MTKACHLGSSSLLGLEKLHGEGLNTPFLQHNSYLHGCYIYNSQNYQTQITHYLTLLFSGDIKCDWAVKCQHKVQSKRFRYLRCHMPTFWRLFGKFRAAVHV